MSLPYKTLIESNIGLQRTLEEYEGGNNVILIAPTGYGKTLLSLELIKKAKGRISSGLIHVVPYRALVRQIYSEKFKGKYPSLGYQSLDEIEREDKSPYYLKELTVTTLDSFIYNLYKLPVAEMYKVLRGKRSQGHYYPVLASILTSTIVFDEAHIYLGAELVGGGESEVETLAFMLAALRFLSEMNVPIIIETATMHSDIVMRVIERLRFSKRPTTITYVGSENTQTRNLQKKLELEMRHQKLKINVIRDKSFEEKHNFPWITQLETLEAAFKRVENICKTEPVLVIHNTIKRAIETYEYLSKKCDKIALLHSLLSNRDREIMLEMASKISISEGAIVSTQVIEAGVETGARVLVTDPAPIENIAQRAGRLCREKEEFKKIFDECKKTGAEVHIIKGDPEKLAEVYSRERVESTLKQLSELLRNNNRAVNWRLLSAIEPGTISFSDLLEYVQLKPLREADFNIIDGLAREYLSSDSQPDILIRFLDELGINLVRSSVLINVVIPPYQNKHLREFEIVTVDFARIMRRDLSDKKCLEYVIEGNKLYPKILLVSRDKSGLKYKESRIKKDLNSINEELKTKRFTYIIELLTRVQDNNKREPGDFAEVFLIAKESCYERGKGLKIWGDERELHK